jgi:hypothetical protein
MSHRDPNQELLARVNRNLAKMYKLELLIMHSWCACKHVLGVMCGSGTLRFGHIRFASLRKMGLEGLVRGLPAIDQVDKLCDACLAGKQRQAPFPQMVTRCATSPLELLHRDLCGPINPRTPRGNGYFLLLVDDYSRYM